MAVAGRGDAAAVQVVRSLVKVCSSVLAVPPGNRLEPLKGQGEGWCTIRADDQGHFVVRWIGGSAGDVEVVDDY